MKSADSVRSALNFIPYIRESEDSLCRDDADTPSLNKCNDSELSNAAVIGPFRNITWPTSVSRYNNTLKCGKVQGYNDIREIPTCSISSVNKPISQTLVFTFIFA